VVDLNHFFLFLALVSPLAVLVRSWWVGIDSGGWRIAAGIVLGVTAIAWVLVRSKAGYIGAGAWFALLFLPAIGLKRTAELSGRHCYAAARRLAAMLWWLHPSADLRDEVRSLRYFESRQLAGELPPPDPFSWRDWDWKQNRLRHAPAVTLLILANMMMFAVELYANIGQPNEDVVLVRLGAVNPALVLYAHQHWRLFAALFLHAGWIHLSFNLFALYIIGPQFERFAGTARFAICYLVAGLCSTTGIVVLWRLGLSTNESVVGASGCIMGIVGALAAFLLRDHRSPGVGRRLTDILMIIVIQTAFDFSTPEISKSAHLFGLVGGFLIGSLVAPSLPRQRLHRST
jgi:membrane associated rhomboid family serine protease